MSVVIKFHGVPTPSTPVFPGGEVIPFPSDISRKAALRFGGRAVGRALLRAIPYAGTAVTLWELYDHLAPVLTINPAKWRFVKDCGGGRTGWTGSATEPPCGAITQLSAPLPFPINASFNQSYGAVTSEPYVGTRTRGVVYERIGPTSSRDYVVVPVEVPYPSEYPAFAPRPNPNIRPWPEPDPYYWPPDPVYPQYPAPRPKERPSPAPNPSPSPKPRPRPRPTPGKTPAPTPAPSRPPMPSPRWDVEFTPGGTAPPRPGQPGPVPGPGVGTSPAPGPLPSPPGRGEREAPKAGSRYHPQVLLDFASEAAEAVDCLYSNMKAVRDAAAARKDYSDRMRAFWDRYAKAKKAGKLGTAKQRAEFLNQKPVWNPAWKDPIVKRKGFADDSHRFGIDRADAKIKYLYDHYKEINSEVLDRAVKCHLLNQAIDPLIAKGSTHPSQIVKGIK